VFTLPGVLRVEELKEPASLAVTRTGLDTRQDGSIFPLTLATPSSEMAVPGYPPALILRISQPKDGSASLHIVVDMSSIHSLHGIVSTEEQIFGDEENDRTDASPGLASPP